MTDLYNFTQAVAIASKKNKVKAMLHGLEQMSQLAGSPKRIHQTPLDDIEKLTSNVQTLGDLIDYHSSNYFLNPYWIRDLPGYDHDYFQTHIKENIQDANGLFLNREQEEEYGRFADIHRESIRERLYSNPTQ